jgi:hypothetical protein
MMTRVPFTRRIPQALMVLWVMLLAALPALAGAQVATPVPTHEALAKGAAWLADQQAEDGGFVGFSGSSDPGVTADALVALSAVRNVGVQVDGRVIDQAVRYLEQNALVYSQTGPGQSAKLALAMVAVGRNPRDVAKVNPLSIVETSARQGLIGFGIFDHALGVLALVAAGASVLPNALQPFKSSQLADGSWAFDGSTTEGAGDTNTTALVIQALAALGMADDPMVENGLAYLAAAQAENGGFPYQPGSAPDANSTALAVQAIIAAGDDPSSSEWKNAMAALAAFQNESGAFRYQDDQPDDNLFATVQALPALAGQPLPVLARGVTPSDGTSVGGATPVGGP